MTDPKRLTPSRLEKIEEFVYGSMMPPLYANELIDEIRAAWRERDAAKVKVFTLERERDQLREQQSKIMEAANVIDARNQAYAVRIGNLRAALKTVCGHSAGSQCDQEPCFAKRVLAADAGEGT